jgi:hypothetical protein
MTDPTGWPDEAREAMAKAIYQRHHKGLRNVWHWDNAGLDIEHPGVRGVYLAQADEALASLAPFVAARVEAAAVAMREANDERDRLAGEVAKLREALERFPKMARSIAADLYTAHSLRGPGASGAMREDDQDLRRAFEDAIAAARAALAGDTDAK